MAKQKGLKYDRFGIVPLHDVLPLLGAAEHAEILGHRVGTSSVRLMTFKEKGHVCVACGVVGTHFAVERDYKDAETDKPYHINLYATRPDGTEVLMTKDHIFPRTLGGPDTVYNMQPMCTVCNGKKGSKLEMLPGYQPIPPEDLGDIMRMLAMMAPEDRLDMTVRDMLTAYVQIANQANQIKRLREDLRNIQQAHLVLKEQNKKMKTALNKRPTVQPPNVMAKMNAAE